MKKILLLLGITLSVLSCKDNLPTEEMAKNGVVETIKIESKDKVKLLDFNKTNALKRTVSEVNYYTVDFEGKITYTENGYSLIYKDYDKDKGFLLVRNDKPLFNSITDFYGEVKKGDERKIKGVITFAKKENGWSKVDVRIYLVDKFEDNK